MGKKVSPNKTQNTKITVSNDGLRIMLCAGDHDLKHYLSLIDKATNITILGDLRLGISIMYSSNSQCTNFNLSDNTTTIHVHHKTIIINGDNLDLSQIMVGDVVILYSNLGRTDTSEMYRFILPIVSIKQNNAHCYELMIYTTNVMFQHITSSFYMCIRPNCSVYNMSYWPTTHKNKVKFRGCTFRGGHDIVDKEEWINIEYKEEHNIYEKSHFS